MSNAMYDPEFYGMLGVFAAQVDDLEAMRIASQHRYRLLATVSEDKDGVVRGMNLGVDHPASGRLRGVVEGMGDLEKKAIRNLEVLMKNSPWYAFQQQATGIGAKQLARLLSATGDPYWHSVQERPRRVGELWAYCGFHAVPIGPDGKVIPKSSQTPSPEDSTRTTGSKANSNSSGEGFYFAAPRRQKGVQANWSEDARKRAWLIATSCLKQRAGTRYRDVYDNTRAKYAEAVHRVPCVRCGPAGKPAEPGTDLSDGHKHGRALRAIAKTVLKDLWVEARRQHGDEDPDGPDAQERREREARAQDAPVVDEVEFDDTAVDESELVDA